MSGGNANWTGDNSLAIKDLVDIIDNATKSAKDQIDHINSLESAVSIGDMFAMQITMNHLAQLSEMSSSVMAASHGAIKVMAQNTRG
ncbi:DUF5407 domain-containing protein [Chlamydiales bacterium]|nr:DUF5407 domain-containing protein [Chlamydiales bacterium]